MARPSFQVKDEHRTTVKTMSGYGYRHEDIAKVLEISPKTLRKHFKSELDRGAVEADSQVIESLFQMAISGKNTAASIFWAKTRCGWLDKPSEENKSPQATPQLIFSGDPK